MAPAGAPPPAAAHRLTTRAFAWLIDVLMAAAAGAVPALVGLWLLVAGGQWSRRSDGTRVLEAVPPAALVLLALAVLVHVLVAAWNQGVRQGRTGHSIGKQRLGLLVLDQHTGAPLGSGRGLLRWALSVVLGAVCLLTYLWAIVDPRARTWHDHLVGSTVVDW